MTTELFLNFKHGKKIGMMQIKEDKKSIPPSTGLYIITAFRILGHSQVSSALPQDRRAQLAAKRMISVENVNKSGSIYIELNGQHIKPSLMLKHMKCLQVQLRQLT